MAHAVEEFEVAVIGAGPAGLASAATLASYGIETLLVDARPAPSALPRATVASTATMELLRRWGLEDEAWSRSIDVEWQAWATPTLAESARGEAIEVGLPTRAQAALISPTAPALLAQDELEPLLERRVRSLPSTRLKRGVGLNALAPASDGGYVLELSGGPGNHRTARAQYVIGADGMRSRVREQVGIPIERTENLDLRLAVHVRAPIWDLVGPHRFGIYFITSDPDGRSFLPAGKPDRWVYATSWSEDAGPVDALDPDQVKSWIRRAAGSPNLPVEIERAMAVRFGVGLADRFREGDVFLVGDAAHRVTPRGGTGLNTAIRDGYDLGWKLAWVLRGWGGERLLETYERERRPVAEYNTERSTRADGSILGNGSGLSVDIGGRIAHAWISRAGAAVSTLDLLGDGLTLFVGPSYEGSEPEAGGAGPPVTAERLDAIAARALGLTPAGSLLARPDGVPVALWNDERPDAPRLARAIAAATGASAPTAGRWTRLAASAAGLALPGGTGLMR